MSSSRDGTTVEPIYNGVGDRVGQTIGVTTTHFALDIQGLPEVIYTDEGELYLHLPGVIVTEKGGEVRYLLSDGLGSIRQATDEAGTVVAYHEFDPYGNPVQNTGGGEPYGYTGEWYESYTELLFLRARWYAAGSGTFLSRDAVETEPAYAYVRGNPVNRVDPTGKTTSSVNSCPKCDFDAKGYAEGYSFAYSILFHSRVPTGGEIAYDFATMERASFKYKDTPLFVLEDPSGFEYKPPGYSTSPLEGAGIIYGINLYGFESMDGIEADYSGRFEGFSLGLNTPGVELGGGYVSVWSHGGDDYLTGELEVFGDGRYWLVGLGIDTPLVVSASVAGTTYTMEEVQAYTSRSPSGLYVPKHLMQLMRSDILSGKYSPLFTLLGPYLNHERTMAAVRLQQTWIENSDYFLNYYGQCYGRLAPD